MWPKGRCLNPRIVVLGLGAPGSSHCIGWAVQWAELGRRPAAAGGIAGRSRAGPGRERAGAPLAGIGLGGRSAPFTPRVCPPDTSSSRSGARRGPPSPQGALSPPLVSGADTGRKSVRQSLPARSSGCGGGPGGRWGWTSTGQARPAASNRVPSASRPRRKVRPPCCVPGRRNAVPARLPEDHLRVPAAGGCDSRLPGDPGPRAAGAPGWVTRSLPAGRGRSDLALLLSVTTNGAGRGVSVSQKRPAEAAVARLRVRAPRAGPSPAPCRVQGARASAGRAGGRRRRASVPTLCPVRCPPPGVAKELGGIYEGLNFYPRAVRK